jgi:hypothetical protein
MTILRGAKTIRRRRPNESTADAFAPHADIRSNTFEVRF